MIGLGRHIFSEYVIRPVVCDKYPLVLRMLTPIIKPNKIGLKNLAEVEAHQDFNVANTQPKIEISATIVKTKKRLES